VTPSVVTTVVGTLYQTIIPGTLNHSMSDRILHRRRDAYSSIQRRHTWRELVSASKLHGTDFSLRSSTFNSAATSHTTYWMSECQCHVYRWMSL